MNVGNDIKKDTLTASNTIDFARIAMTQIHWPLRERRGKFFFKKKEKRKNTQDAKNTASLLLYLEKQDSYKTCILSINA